MTPLLLGYLCDPELRQPLILSNATYDAGNNIVSGDLTSENGHVYPIVNGIPRLLLDPSLKKSVESFGDEWNTFNFIDFKLHWLKHLVANTFGSTEAFRDKLIVDAGGGSGSQTLWMLESGARHVVMLDLSHSVDDVVQRNLGPSGFTNYDVVQCSIDAPPIKPQSIPGLVICHNVIQHTPSVEKTATALFGLVAPGGEFAFNCYPTNDDRPLRWIRFHLIYRPLRLILSHLPFKAISFYAKSMGVLRLVPGLGYFLEKAGFCVQGDVPSVPEDSAATRRQRRYRATVLNTFDYFGSHSFQHHKSDAEMRSLVSTLQQDPTKILNVDSYFARPPNIGCALRIFR